MGIFGSAQGERGATAIIVAASLVMLMGFAAIAVDLGAAFSQRRQDQSAADVAALAAVQFARGSSDVQTAANNGASEARSVADASLEATLSNAQWTACSDSSRPTEFEVISAISPCISFTANLQKSRVLIPTVDVNTTFGRAIGFDKVETSAFAEAQADLAQIGQVMPFGLPAGSAGQIEVCLRDSGTPPPPCDGSDDGNFGTLDFSLYHNDSLGTLETCGNTMPQGKLEANMVAGVDHPISTIFSGGVRTDSGYCPIFNARPNYVAGQTGIGSALYSGMIDGSSSRLTAFRPGRIARGSNTINVERGSDNVDNTGLWAYLDGTGTQPASCDSVSSTAGMADCISDWRAGSYGNPLFTLSLGEAVRFGAVPQINANTWGNGTQTYGIVAMVPVYIEATFWGCTGNGNGNGNGNGGGGGGGGGGANCAIIHYPGDSLASSGLGATVNGANRLNAVTAFVLDVDMLPEPLRSSFPATPEQVDYALTR